MQLLKWGTLGTLLLLMLIVIFQNLTPIEIHFLFSTLSLPQAAVIALTLLVGFCLGLLASAAWRVRSWRARVSKDRKAQQVQAGDKENV